MTDINKLPGFLDLPKEKRDEFIENVDLSTEITGYMSFEVGLGGHLIETAPENFSDNNYIVGQLFGIEVNNNAGISIYDLIHEAYRLYKEHNYEVDKVRQALDAEYALD